MMTNLETLTGNELSVAIENNFLKILEDNPEKFKQNFINIYNIDSNKAIRVFFDKIMNDDFALKHPNILFDVCEFIFIKKQLYGELKNIPLVYYQNSRENYLALMKIALNNCSNIYNVNSLLSYVYNKTNDDYFRLVSILLSKKGKDYIDSTQIFVSIDNINNIKEILINWEQHANLYYEKTIFNSNDLNEQKNQLSKKIYNVDIEELKQGYYQYILSNTSIEFDRELIYCERILKATTKNELIQIYHESLELKNELKSTLSNVMNKIDTDSKHSISKASSYRLEQELVVQKINNTNIYDISESNFNLIIHNISPGLGHNEISQKINNDLSFWGKNNVEGSITISSSEISNKFLGHLSRKKNGIPEVIFAFTDIPDKEVFFASASDMGFATKIKDYSNLSSGDVKGYHYLADQLMTNCFFHYNEIVINRFEDKTKTNKRLPNYIVCFDEINNLSLQYAEYFNIPILFINTQKCAYKTANDIKDKLQKATTANELLNNMNELLSFISGLTYSKTIFEIVDTYDWEQIIIDAIKNNLENIENIDMAKNLLLIIDYVEQNCNKYLDNLSRQFNDYSNENYDRVINKFSNLPEKIFTIKQILFNEVKLEVEKNMEYVEILENQDSINDRPQK